MVKHLLLAFCSYISFAFPMCAYAQKMGSKIIKIPINKENFVFKKNIEGKLTVTSKFSNSFYENSSEALYLPIITFNMVVGKYESCDSITISCSETVIEKDVEIAHAPNYLTRRSSSVQASVMPEHSVALSMKESLVHYMENVRFAGINVVRFSVCPFKYDSLSRELRCCDTLTVSLSLNQNGNNMSSKIHVEDIDLLRRQVINPDDIDKLYFPDKYRSFTSSTITSADSIKYLIITNPRLKSAFLPLANWKNQKGVPSKILSIYEIYSNYDGATDQLKIKNCIKDYYDRCGLKYVLIGGDANVIPTQICNYLDMSGSLPIPTDYFYACLDENNFDWDENNDGVINVYREINANADISISRAPVQNVEQATSFVEKILSYEKNPSMNAEYDKILMAGTKTYRMVGNKSDSQYQSEQMYDSLIAPFWSGDCKELFDTYTNINTVSTPNFSPDNLVSEFKSGYPFVDIICHGDTTLWVMEDDVEFDTSISDTINFCQPTIITTGACLTNAFNSSTDPCLSESFLRNPNCGVLAFLGSSVEGWVLNTDTIIGPSERYTGNFYAELFSQPAASHFGDAVRRAKNNVVLETTDGLKKALFCSLNPLGDPEMPIFVTQPNIFSHTYIDIYGNNLGMRVSAPEATVCVMSLGDDGNSFYHVGKTGDIGNWYSCNIPEKASIVITKEGYIPEIHYYANSDTVYIQNIAFEGDAKIHGNVVKIGSRVTNPPYGEVVVAHGINEIKATQSVSIDGEFEIKKGAEFSIEIEN